MSIEEMLKDVKVEWKKLGEVFEIRNGYTPSKQNKDFWENGTIPWFRMDDLREQGKIVSNSKQHITEKAIKGKGLFKANSIILSTTATIGEHAMLVVDSLANQQFTNFKIYKSFEDKLLPKYVFYYFDIIDEWCKKNTKVSSFPAVNMDSLLKLSFPIPPLEIQEKIVKTLDFFTKYVTELQAELQNRKKQYTFFRDKLLSEDYLNKIIRSLNNDCENFTLQSFKVEDLCFRQKGINITASQMQELNNKNGDIKVFAAGNTYANVFKCDIDENSIIYSPSIIVKSRGNIDFEYYDKPFTHKNEMWSYSIKDNKNYNLKYIYYYLKNNINYFKDRAISGKLPQISIDVTEKFNIIVPHISIQNRIVKVLDKFQELIENTEGLLPKEIEERQKQYEYYREKLLTFNSEYDKHTHTHTHTHTSLNNI